MGNPRPGIGKIHVDKADVGVGVALDGPGKHVVDRLRQEVCIVDFRKHVVVDVDYACQLESPCELNSYQQLVLVTEHMCRPHRTVDLNVRQTWNPLRQSIIPRSHLASTAILSIRLVEHQFGENRQQRGGLPRLRAAEASDNTVHIDRLALAGPPLRKWIGHRHADHDARQAEQTERMPTLQRAPYHVDE